MLHPSGYCTGVSTWTSFMCKLACWVHGGGVVFWQPCASIRTVGPGLASGRRTIRLVLHRIELLVYTVGWVQVKGLCVFGCRLICDKLLSAGPSSGNLSLIRCRLHTCLHVWCVHQCGMYGYCFCVWDNRECSCVSLCTCSVVDVFLLCMSVVSCMFLEGTCHVLAAVA